VPAGTAPQIRVAALDRPETGVAAGRVLVVPEQSDLTGSISLPAAIASCRCTFQASNPRSVGGETGFGAPHRRVQPQPPRRALPSCRKCPLMPRIALMPMSGRLLFAHRNAVRGISLHARGAANSSAGTRYHRETPVRLANRRSIVEPPESSRECPGGRPVANQSRITQLSCAVRDRA
jgi:hypothetical protein